MYKAVILPPAKQDINEAALWYNSKQAGLGKRFTVHIREKIHLLKQNPHSVTIRYDDTRTAVLDVFPFMIHYIIKEFQKKIIITAILHTSRNPEIWTPHRQDDDDDDRE